VFICAESLCCLGSGEWNPTLALEPAAFGAWNADNSLVCSELRRKWRVIAEKIKKSLTVINRY
jgi:hypothetical protein